MQATTLLSVVINAQLAAVILAQFPFPDLQNSPDNGDPRGAKIFRSSHFSQSYKLGYKILLVCMARGDPLPRIKWFKDGGELQMKPNIFRSEVILDTTSIKSKIEIDPAKVGDQGVYTCMASNPHAMRVKNFKTEYYY